MSSDEIKGEELKNNGLVQLAPDSVEKVLLAQDKKKPLASINSLENYNCIYIYMGRAFSIHQVENLLSSENFIVNNFFIYKVPKARFNFFRFFAVPPVLPPRF